MKWIYPGPADEIERKGLKFPKGKAVEIDRPFAPGDFNFLRAQGAFNTDEVRAVPTEPAEEETPDKLEYPTEEEAPPVKRKRGRPRKNPYPYGS